MSKKVWDSCKILLLLSGAAFAQTSQKNDGTASPGVSMPEMPGVSMPSVGSGFYTPGRSDFYNPNLTRSQNRSKTQTASQGQSDSQKQTAASSVASQNQNAKAQTEAQKLSTLAKSASSSFNQLTADDISSLSNLGSFSQISNLLGKGNNLQEQFLSSQNTVTANTADSLTLKQILSELSELKNKINAGDIAAQKQTTDISGNFPKNENISLNDKSSGKDGFTAAIKKEPKILRFIVNGYDILATCKKIYFSETETDGTFLLTGDRKYLSENIARSETFYFFFKSRGIENGITKYAVTPAVSQDYENEYSYLYQLTQKSELTAKRTGNLVTLRVSEGSWNMDLLISLDR
ncbi:MAG: hypothetical protein II821_08605 [Treponema sp.]|nr:hypothetical protein [Treponema sp.]